MKKRSILSILCFVLVCLLILSACSSGTKVIDEKVQEEEPLNEETEEKESVETAAQNGLEEEEIKLKITTSDGRVLDATYYPAAKLNAPVIILLHWAMGEQSDWEQIAYWLQNRGAAGISDDNKNSPWLDPSWFPAMPTESSYNVLTFTFDNCANGGCKSFTRDQWLLDAQAAFEAARTLEGVDPTRIVGIGASIGADGAADGCLYLNTEYPGTCKGALSLSPGNYLTLSYADVVRELSAMQPAVPTQCFYAVGDNESATVCKAIKNVENFTVLEYQGSAHGMQLIQPELEHDTLTLIQEFISDTVGEH